jgi:hypothetical protein
MGEDVDQQCLHRRHEQPFPDASSYLNAKRQKRLILRAFRLFGTSSPIGENERRRRIYDDLRNVSSQAWGYRRLDIQNRLS